MTSEATELRDHHAKEGKPPLAEGSDPPSDHKKQPQSDGGLSAEADKAAAQSPAPLPDGGSEAWLQVLASWCLMFNTLGTIAMFGVYQAYYERGILFTQSSSNISWIGAVQSLVFFFAGTLAGPDFDHGYLKTLILIGGSGIVFGQMMLSLCSEFWQVILAQGLVVGIGAGCLFVPSLAIIQSYFRSRLGLAIGLVGTGSSLGSILYPIIFINCIDRVGFGWTTRILAFIALAIQSIPLAISRLRAKPSMARKLFDLSILTDGKFMLCILGILLGYAGTQAALFYLAFFSQANNWLPGNVSLYLLPIMNATAIIGRVLSNAAADKIGATNVVVPGAILLGVVTLCNIAVTGARGVISTAVFFSLLSGIFVSLPPLLFMILTKDKTKLGTRMGIGYAFIGLSVLLAGPPTGAILQHDPKKLDWVAAWVYAGILPMAASLTVLLLRAWHGGLKIMVKV